MALFDKSQHLRNKKAIFEENRCESLFIYCFTHCKHTNFIHPDVYELDMNYLLNGEEVLSIGLDDYVHDKVTQITVQSKSLTMYIVDFEMGRVIKEIDKEF